MKIDELWRELEREAEGGRSDAWLTRFAIPDPRNSLLVALETVGIRRALLLPLRSTTVPPKSEWPVCVGLEVFVTPVGGTPHLGVRLVDSRSADVFSALAEDLAPRVAAAIDPPDGARIMLARLRRWQRFLAAGAEGLSIERQRGLFGELYTLREVLLPALGSSVAVTGWRASRASHQDFQYGIAAVEVKTTTAKQPTTVRITSERQLDTTGITALYLFVLVLDERETDANSGTEGENLSALVASLRRLMAPDELGEFDDRLLDWGYLDADVERYRLRQYTRRYVSAYKVREGFPVVTEKSLPKGVGDVSYALSLAACEPFAVSLEQMLAELRPSTAIL